MNTYFERIASWKHRFKSRKTYTTMAREPFYDIAIPYLPADGKGVIVDIGSGEGGFTEYLDLHENYNDLFLLDASRHRIDLLKEHTDNAILYKAPETLPFEDNSVSFIHCSHLIEHLYHAELYALLREIDRVLKNQGILMISAPLLWNDFYNDLSHVKPYYPSVFIRYLCNKHGEETASIISNRFIIHQLVYRYTISDFGEWGASWMALDFFIQALKFICRKIGIHKYSVNGFTLVLEKHVGQ